MVMGIMNVGLKGLLALAVFFICTVGANFCFKSGATALHPLRLSLETLTAAATSPYVVAGVTLYSVAAVAWFVALSLVPLNIAISVSASIYLVVVLMSFFLFGEAIPPLRWVGIASVAFGMLIVGRTA